MPALQLPFGYQLCTRGHRETPLTGKALCSFTDEKDVTPSFHNGPSQEDRIAHGPDRAHSAGLKRCALHQRGIDLNVPFLIEARTDPGVKHRIVFQLDYRPHRRI